MYPTTEDLVAASTVSALTNAEPAQQDGYRQAAINSIENHCGQKFITEGTVGSPVTRRIDGSGTESLLLPARISELVSVTALNGGGVSVDNVQISDDRERLTVVGTGQGSTWADRALADARGRTELVFPAGVDNIEVSGVWGWTPEEYDELLGAVTTAIRFDMEDKALAATHALGDTVRASRALGLSSVDQGRLSINLGEETELSARVRQQLVPFVFEHAAGAVA